MHQEWRKDLPIYNNSNNNTIIMIIIITIIMMRRTTQPICWKRRKLVVYTVENIFYNTCNYFISIKLTWKRTNVLKNGKNIPFNHFFFLICRVQKLNCLIRSLHWKVSDWERKSSPDRDRATDWNTWSIAR